MGGVGRMKGRYERVGVSVWVAMSLGGTSAISAKVHLCQGNLFSTLKQDDTAPFSPDLPLNAMPAPNRMRVREAR